jgi:predicted DNA-binding transcriptional regulator AlpA
MQKVERWVEKLYQNRLLNDYDAIVPVLGGEGNGKSTLILQVTTLHQRARGLDPTAESVLDRVVWQDRQELKNRMADAESLSAITVHDAARVLHKKQAMHGEQIELETDLLDVRTKNFLMLFGFQDWGVIPGMLQDRRANALLRVPERGRVEGYSRASIDERVDTGEWPAPDMVDSFPSLEGTDLWEQFVETDEEKKNERIAGEEQLDPDDAARREQIRAALRACQPWRPDGVPMTQREAAEIVGKSASWVNRRAKELEAGYHRDLVADMPGAPNPLDETPSYDYSPDSEEVEG